MVLLAPAYGSNIHSLVMEFTVVDWPSPERKVEISYDTTVGGEEWRRKRRGEVREMAMEERGAGRKGTAQGGGVGGRRGEYGGEGRRGGQEGGEQY